MTDVRPSFLQYGPDIPAFPIILAVPHAGRDYPASLLAASRLRSAQLRQLEDRHADLLVTQAVDAGFTALVATRARAWIDLNRNPREIDPDLVAEPGVGTALMISDKVRGGLGLFPRRLRGFGDLWRRRFTPDDLRARIANDHAPYHARIADLLNTTVRRFGIAILLDVHSMPPLPPTPGPAVSLVVGDQFGRSASARFSAVIREIGSRAGHVVAENAPYAGGYSLVEHGAPDRGIHALQIELDRRLYLDRQLDGPDANGLAASRALISRIANALAIDARHADFAVAAE